MRHCHYDNDVPPAAAARPAPAADVLLSSLRGPGGAGDHDRFGSWRRVVQVASASDSTQAQPHEPQSGVAGTWPGRRTVAAPGRASDHGAIRIILISDSDHARGQ
jgi:hypothetical protein